MLKFGGLKKVMFVITGLNVGGAEQQVVALALRFRELGIDVVVVTLIEPGRMRQDLDAANIPVISLGMKRGLPGPAAIFRLAKIVRREQPSVVHAHMFHANILSRVSRVLWRRIPLVSTIHNVIEASSRSPHFDSRKTWRDDAYRFTNLLSSRTTSICDAATERFIEVGAFNVRNIQTMPNGVIVSNFARNAEAGAELRAELGLEEKTVGLMVARMEPPKDHPLALRAWAAALKKYPELHLVFVGDGPNRSELEKLAAELKIDRQVTFAGIRKDVKRFLSMADFFMLITTTEGLPISILEAASASLPVIASAVGGVPEAVRDGRSGILAPPSNLDLLTQAIETMANYSPETRRAMGEEGRQLVSEQYDLGVVVQRWLATYSEVMKN